MIVINNTYFKGEIYLPEAKPGIESDVTDVESKAEDFIDDYVPECLIKCLGSRLAYEFMDQLEYDKPNGLKDAADAKWNLLLNGMPTYTNPSGNDVVWKGIRYKTNSSGSYNRSFLANYVYYFYESNNSITRSGAGNVKIQSANAILTSGGHKAVKSWRRFVELVQGAVPVNPYFKKSGRFGGIGVDHQGGVTDKQISLYQFIKDQNELTPNTYENFVPMTWKNINQLGI